MDCDRPPIRTIGDLYRVARRAGGFWVSLASCAYLAMFIIPAWAFSPVPQALLVTVLCLAIGTLLVLSGGARMLPDRARWAYVALLLALLLGLVPVVGWETVYGGVYPAMVIAVVLDWSHARRLLPVLAVVLLALTIPRADWFGVAIAVVGMVMGLGVGAMIHQQVIQDRLDAAERRNATLAVAAERERIGRDLHDILGHSLTVIAMNAQVAQRLLDKDADAARQRMADVEATARQALADVRATASTMRTVRLATELSSARSVLAAADIRVEVPASLPSLDDAASEALGYAVREAVTNVVRHSRATACTVAVAETPDGIALTISDDGVGLAAARAGGRGDGSGLRGLTERLAALGGSLTTTDEGPGTTLLARVPKAPVRA
jgi:two-component system, NarL family, sensor histidine kinase DesK